MSDEEEAVRLIMTLYRQIDAAIDPNPYRPLGQQQVGTAMKTGREPVPTPQGVCRDYLKKLSDEERDAFVSAMKKMLSVATT